MTRLFQLIFLLLTLVKFTVESRAYNGELSDPSSEVEWASNGRLTVDDWKQGAVILVDVVVFIDFDDFPNEISWRIEDEEGIAIVFRPFDFYPLLQDTTREVVSLIAGRDYIFLIEDNAGDGMTIVDGSYSITQDTEVLVSGDGDFGDSRETPFTTVTPPTEAPTVGPPTDAPTPTEDPPTDGPPPSGNPPTNGPPPSATPPTATPPSATPPTATRPTVAPPSTTPAPTGNTTERTDRFPYYVLFPGRNCSGSLIALDVVLTVAHCGVEVGDDVEVGRYDLSSDDFESFSVNDTLTHPFWTGNATDIPNYDVMLVKINGDSTNDFVEMNSDNSFPIFENQALSWIGFEFDEFGIIVNDTILQDEIVEYYPNDVCETFADPSVGLNYSGLVTDQWLCAGGDSNETCFGEGGNPLVYTVDDSPLNDTLVGLAAINGACESANVSDVYVRVSELYDWIVNESCWFTLSPPVYFNCSEPTDPPGPTSSIPSDSPSSFPTSGTPVVLIDALLFIEFDDNPEEIFWSIQDVETGDTVASNGFYPPGTSTVQETIFLFSVTSYNFIIEDIAGNGMNNPSGAYSLNQSGTVLFAEDGNFESTKTTQFTTLPDAVIPTEPPILAPTIGPSGVDASGAPTGTGTSVAPSALSSSSIPSDFPSAMPSSIPSDTPSTMPSNAPSFGPTVFEESLIPTSSPSGGGDPSGQVEVVVFIEFDSNPDEIFWYIEDPATGAFVASNGFYPQDQATTSESVLLMPEATYFFTIEDEVGNGMTNLTGSYSVSQDGNILVSGNGDFEFFEATEFTTGPALPLVPTSLPSVAPAETSIQPTGVSAIPSDTPSQVPSVIPSDAPSVAPSQFPTSAPVIPSNSPSVAPILSLSSAPSVQPTGATLPSASPSIAPAEPSAQPTGASAIPSDAPSQVPSVIPSDSPSVAPSQSLSSAPSGAATPATPTSTPVEGGPVVLTIVFGDYPEEIGYHLSHLQTGKVIDSRPPGSFDKSTSYFEVAWDLNPGLVYVLRLDDSAGDGLCCLDPPGTFTLRQGTEIIDTFTGNFGDSVSYPFIPN